MHQGFDIEELERFRRLAAFMILEYGPEFGYVLDRIELMLEAARKQDPKARALRILSELKTVAPAATTAPRLITEQLHPASSAEGVPQIRKKAARGV